MLITTSIIYGSTKLISSLALRPNSEKELSFNVETFQQIKADAENTANEINELKVGILNSIDNLRSGWKTPAGAYFFEHIDTEWTTDLDKYVQILRIFEDVMDSLIEIFTDVETNIEALKL